MKVSPFFITVKEVIITKLTEWIRSKIITANLKGNIDTDFGSYDCNDLCGAVQNIWVRELAKNVAINLIANAVGKCEFKTFISGKEAKEKEYFLWNYQPNINQNSSTFLHKLVWQLCNNGKALVIESRGQLVVADDFTRTRNAFIGNTYADIQVEDLTMSKKFKEEDVLYFELNNKNMRVFFDGLYNAYVGLFESSVDKFNWMNGHHWKVKVNATAAGEEGFKEKFKDLQEKYLKPFFNSRNAALPEFTGYEHEDVNKGADRSKQSTRDIRALVDDVFAFAAKCFGIPAVLMGGEVQGTSDAIDSFLTFCIDPICKQLQEEIVRKRYGFEGFSVGDYLTIDTTAIKHFDWIANATNVDKLISSGVKSVNEIRVLAGDTPIKEEWADKHFITKNYSEMADMEKDDDQSTIDSDNSKTVSEVSLNGAQIDSLLTIVQSVVANTLGYESAITLITAAFPFDEKTAREILGNPNDLITEKEADVQVENENADN